MNGTKGQKTEKAPEGPSAVVKKFIAAGLRYLIFAFISVFIGYGLYSVNAEKIMGNQLPMPFGYGMAVVMSGSMEPALSVGDLVLIRERKPGETYESGEIAVYRGGTAPVIHRVTGRNGQGQYIFKGDANNVQDEPVDEARVLGSFAARIPGAGRLIYGIKNPFSMTAMLLIAVLLIVYPGQDKDDETEELLREIESIREEIKRQNKDEKEDR